jgi:hypothetical protein
MAIPAFKYQSILPGQAFRLLRILPATELKFELIHIEIAKAPAYVALSYVWGAPIFDHVITVDGHPFAVTGNLHAALASQSSRIRDEGNHLWVDAICINQEDISERSSQVSLMSRIYKSATHVLAWLGQASSDSDLALHSMHVWAEYSDQLFEKHGNSWAAVAKTASLENVVCGPSADKAWCAIHNLCEREWWTRSWVVQEATSPVHTWLCCGEKYTDLDFFSQIMLLMWALCDYTGYDYKPSEKALRFDVLRTLRCEDHEEQKDTALALLPFLCQVRVFNCLDPRDRVYAALGLPNTKNTIDQLVPDYTRSVVEVYIDVVKFALHHLESGHQLDFLGDGVRLEDSADISDGSLAHTTPMPTWVPDWRFQQLELAFAKAKPDFEHKGPRVYNADGGHSSQVFVEEQSLMVHGLQIGIVEAISSIQSQQYGNLTALKEDMSRKEGFWKQQVPANISNPKILEADVWNRTYVADVKRTGLAGVSRGYSVDWTLLNADASHDTQAMSEWNDLLQSVEIATSNRRLAWMDSGHLGLVPAAAKVGDTVHLLYGGQLLYALRRTSNSDDTYEFVGECYFDGIMDGEAVRYDEGGTFKNETIALI